MLPQAKKKMQMEHVIPRSWMTISGLVYEIGDPQEIPFLTCIVSRTDNSTRSNKPLNFNGNGGRDSTIWDGTWPPQNEPAWTRFDGNRKKLAARITAAGFLSLPCIRMPLAPGARPTCKVDAYAQQARIIKRLALEYVGFPGDYSRQQLGERDANVCSVVCNLVMLYTQNLCNPLWDWALFKLMNKRGRAPYKWQETTWQDDTLKVDYNWCDGSEHATFPTSFALLLEQRLKGTGHFSGFIMREFGDEVEDFPEEFLPEEAEALREEDGARQLETDPRALRLEIRQRNRDARGRGRGGGGGERRRGRGGRGGR